MSTHHLAMADDSFRAGRACKTCYWMRPGVVQYTSIIGSCQFPPPPHVHFELGANRGVTADHWCGCWLPHMGRI